MLDLLVRFLGSVILDVVGTATAAAILPLVTFRKLMVERPGLPSDTRWHGFAKLPDGTIIVGEPVAALIGLAVWVVLGAVLVHVVQSW